MALSVRQIIQLAASELHQDYEDTALTDLVLPWINETIQDIASVEMWKWLEGQVTLLFGTHGAGANTSNGITYLPHYIHKLISVWPGGLSYREQVHIIGGWELDALDPSMVTGSPADYLALWGYYNVARDNPTAGVITVADAGAATFSVIVEGIDANGREAVETVGVVAGAGVTTGTFAAGPDGVRRCYIVENSVTAGTPTIVTFTSGGTEIERLNYTMGELQHEHLRTELSPAPNTTGESYLVRYQKRIRPASVEGEMPYIPFEFENLLTYGVKKRLAAFDGRDQKVLLYEQLYRTRLNELKKWQNKQPGRLRSLRPLAASPTRWPY